MSATVTVGKRLIPIEHIALIEPFDPAAHPRMQTERPFKARIVLIDRESVLTEEALEAFAERHGFRLLSEDGIATNPAIHFSVAAFEPAEGFNPTKPYLSRLSWRDQDGNAQSKLLLAAPESVLAVVVRGEPVPTSSAEPAKTNVRRNRRQRSNPTPA